MDFLDFLDFLEFLDFLVHGCIRCCRGIQPRKQRGTSRHIEAHRGTHNGTPDGTSSLGQTRTGVEGQKGHSENKTEFKNKPLNHVTPSWHVRHGDRRCSNCPKREGLAGHVSFGGDTSDARSRDNTREERTANATSQTTIPWVWEAGPWPVGLAGRRRTKGGEGGSLTTCLQFTWSHTCTPIVVCITYDVRRIYIKHPGMH